MRFLPLAFVAAIASAPPAAAQAGNPDLSTLLAHLAEHSARLEALSRESTVTRTARSEQLDRKGKVESVTESVERVFYRDGAEVRELVRFTRDGKDLTEKEKARRGGKEKESGHSLSLSLVSPFSEAEARKYRFTLLAPDPSDPAGRRIRFEPKAAPSVEVNTGEAVVDPAAGSPIRIRYHPSVNPKHMDRIEVEMVYGADTAAGPALSTVSIDGEGGMLFIRKGFRTRIVFSGYAAKTP